MCVEADFATPKLQFVRWFATLGGYPRWNQSLLSASTGSSERCRSQWTSHDLLDTGPDYPAKTVVLLNQSPVAGDYLLEIEH